MDKRASNPFDIDVVLGRHPEYGFVIDGDVPPEAEELLQELGYSRNKDDVLTLTLDLDERTARSRHARAAQLLAAFGLTVRVLSDDEAARLAAAPTPDPALDATFPDPVIDIVHAAAGFEDTVQRVGTAELAHAAAGLDALHLAYLLDRLDDTRASIAEILSAILDEGLTELDEDSAPMLSEVCGDLERAGDGLFVVVSDLDPGSLRRSLTLPDLT